MTATTDTQMRKFLFDRSFDQSSKPEEKSSFSGEQLKKAKDEAYEQGFADAQHTANEKQASDTAAMLGRVEQQLAAIIGNVVEARKQQLSDTVEIATHMVRKLIPDYITRNGMNEIEAILQQALSELSREPRLVVRVAEERLDDLNAQLAKLAEQTAFAGKVVLLGDNDLAASDCKVEWADGGIERDVNLIWQQIDRAVAHARQSIPAEQTTPQHDTGEAAETNEPDPSATNVTV
ncbi:MAG: hypothetical protein GC131_04305 [Alphaproteobacteria bacterium]|nr:hypothetical protein [Alphaproteobacteria bacterium]